ncbi:MAG: hypothetical protein WAW41_10915 [Methylobacter sp.]
MKHFNSTIIKVLFACLIITLNMDVTFANSGNPTELEFKIIVQRMRLNTERIKTLKKLGKVVTHERGFLRPNDKWLFTQEEEELLAVENADRTMYFIFLTEHSDSIDAYDESRIPDKLAVSYERVAQYCAKKWKEWPPR